MKTHARVVVIGGGIVGCSVLYHLTRMGWTDVALVERAELTAGSTWHAAGNCPNFSTSFNIMKLQAYSNRLYRRLPEEVDAAIGHRACGSIRLAHTADRMAEFRHVAEMAAAQGLAFEILSPAADAGAPPVPRDPRHPGRAVGPRRRRHRPVPGHPGARQGRPRCRCCDLPPQSGPGDRARRVRRVGGRDRRTARSACEIVVNAAGYRAREVGRMVGLDLPVVSLQHQYLVTEAIPAIAAHGRPPAAGARSGRLLVPAPGAGGAAARALRVGLPARLGRQRAAGRFRHGAVRGRPRPPRALHRGRDGAGAGLRQRRRHPRDQRPDPLHSGRQSAARPRLRPRQLLSSPAPSASASCRAAAPARRWPSGSSRASRSGISGRSTRAATPRSPPRATCAPRHLSSTSASTRSPTRSRSARPGGRPRPRRSIQTLAAKGAMFGARGGWERATWFVPEGEPAEQRLSFGHGNWHAAVAEECRAVRERVGVLDLGGFAKFEVAGAGAAAFLDRLICGRLPRVGRVALAYMCSPAGGLLCELTITRLAADRFYLAERGQRRMARPPVAAAPAPAGARASRSRTSRRATARWCWRARAPARCWARSPTPTSRTRRSRGSRRAGSRSASHEFWRCASAMSASSASSCTSRSSTSCRSITR